MEPRHFEMQKLYGVLNWSGGVRGGQPILKHGLKVRELCGPCYLSL
jgi:hypothetical protein